MNDKNIINSVTDNESVKKYMTYFSEDLDAIEEELQKSKEYSKIIDDEIAKLSGVQSLGSNKGSQRYLIEHITNAVSLQTQRQSLRKDRVAVKKMIIDFASRDTKSEDGQAINLTETVERLIKNARENITSVSQSQQINTDLDSDIDAILGEKDE
jgi:hypothetical protein